MTILDAQLLLSDAQAVTSTEASDNIIDLGPLHADNTERDIGQGEGLRLVIITDTTALSTGSSTVTFALQTDDTSTFGSATTLWQSSAIAKATLVAGYRVADIAIPKGCEKYLRLNYTVATADLTAGAFTAFLCKDSQDNKSYANAYT
jgi:hypothetical protein